MYVMYVKLVERMLEIYGSWEEFEAEKKLRSSQKEVRAEKNFEKKVKEMRQHVSVSVNITFIILLYYFLILLKWAPL